MSLFNIGRRLCGNAMGILQMSTATRPLTRLSQRVLSIRLTSLKPVQTELRGYAKLEKRCFRITEIGLKKPSYEEAMAVAKYQFRHDDSREVILEAIETCLKEYKETGRIEVNTFIPNKFDPDWQTALAVDRGLVEFFKKNKIFNNVSVNYTRNFSAV